MNNPSNQTQLQHDSRYAYVITWFTFFKWGTGVTFLHLILYFLFNFYASAIVFFCGFACWAYVRIRKQCRIESLKKIVIPTEIWQAFARLHPQYGAEQHRMIAEGFKDYLAIHILQRRNYAMPSHAIDALWHLLLEHRPEFYKQCCLKYLGFELHHLAHVSTPSVQQKQTYKRQLMATWQKSCHLQGLSVQPVLTFPRLFQIDQRLMWQGGLILSVEMVESLSAEILTIKQQHSSSSSLNGSESACSSSDISHSNSSSDCGLHSSDSNSSDSSCSPSSCSSCGSSSD